jgi:hypothetical protein
MTFFKTIIFGENTLCYSENAKSFFNEKSTHSTQRSAERHGLDRLCIAGTYGYVVIKQDHEQWSVVDEMGLTADYAVVSKWGGVFYVEKAKPVNVIGV